jgi:putative redox protein
MLRASLGERPYRVDMTVDGHAIVGDEAAEHGGGGEGPSPFDLVLAGLAACTLITLRMYAERKGWTIRVDGQFRHRVEDGRHLIDRHLQVGGVPDEAGLARLRDIAERTPVTLALKSGFEIATMLTAHAAHEAQA